MYLATINVHYLNSVVNPEAERLSEFFKRQDQTAVNSVQISKTFQLTLEANSKDEVQALAEKLTKDVLVNPRMEDFELSVEEA